VTRLILAVAIVLSAVPAFAQAEAEWTPEERREQTRQERREEAQRRREEAREQREERREERREQWERWRREGRDGVHLRMLRDYYLSADATASEPIVVLGGDATIDGRADNDVVVIGGTLRLGPKAVVSGDVVTVGGEAVIDPAATVRGKIDTAVVVWPNLDFGFGWSMWGWGGWWPFAAVSATVLRLSLVLSISLLLTVVTPGWIRSMGVRASSALSSGILGAIAEVLFVPALLAVVIGLTISIVGHRSAGVDRWIRRRRRLPGCTAARQQRCDFVGARRRSPDRLCRHHRADDDRARHLVRTWLVVALRVDESRGGNRGRVRGLDDRSRGGPLRPVRQIAVDAADARDVNVLASRSSTRARTVGHRYSRSTNASPWAPSARRSLSCEPR
jgi:hypothetical protein